MRANTRVGGHIGQRALRSIPEIDLPDAQELEERSLSEIREASVARGSQDAGMVPKPLKYEISNISIQFYH